MKQYKDAPIVIGHPSMLYGSPHIRTETLTVQVKRDCKGYRRRHNKSAVTWWRLQIKTNGMPWAYHCWGW